MRWKLLVWVIVLLVVVAFVSFNVDNRSDISFGFRVITDVPVFASTFVSFAIGALVGLTAAVGSSRKKAKTAPETEPSEDPPEPKRKRRRGSRKSKQDQAVDTEQ